MTQLSKAKKIVRDFYAALDAANGFDVADVIRKYCADDYTWRGFHPFGEMTDPAEVADTFWAPLKSALRPMQRRMDAFFGGQNEMDGFASTWVVSMGHLMGLMDEPWLGLPTTGKIAMLRYCEFHRVDGDQITQTAMYFDIPHLMIQLGLSPFPSQSAAHLVQPGPMPHDALLFENAPEQEGIDTLATINAMITDLGQWKSGMTLEDELRRTWVEDMLWWGPAGIGSSYTIERYAKQHSGPFRAAFSDRSKTTHICRLAEGHYGGFFGWPNFTATLTGPLMGFPATGKRGEFRVIDIYRRSGNKLAENWIFIDVLHFWKQMGIDILADHTQ